MNGQPGKQPLRSCTKPLTTSTSGVPEGTLIARFWANGVFLIRAASPGFLTSSDQAALLRAAEGAGAVVRVDREPGSTLVEGVPFAAAWPAEPGAAFTPAAREDLSEAVNAAVATGFERTNVQDVGFGLRQLVDVAARALSPGANDPTTAVHVIGLPDLRELLELAMNQTRQYGAADSAVTGRLLQLLQELSWCDRKGRYRAEILDQLGRMRSDIAAAGFTSVERSSLIDEADATETGQQQGSPS